jgi:riboflavin synthase alpha subunit
LTNEHHALSIKEKDLDQLKHQLTSEQQKNVEANKVKQKLDLEIDKLTKIIKQAHEEHEKLKKDY